MTILNSKALIVELLTLILALAKRYFRDIKEISDSKEILPKRYFI